MRIFSLAYFFLMVASAHAQHSGVVYLFPGQGSDSRLFDELQIDSQFEVRVIHYPIPECASGMAEFAALLIPQIDTSLPYYFIGVSMGGMICVELCDKLHPQKTIIISSAQTKFDLPLRYRFQQQVPLYKIFPGSWILEGAKLLQPWVEPDRNKHKEVFKSMLASKDPVYMKRTVEMIVKWERTTSKANIYQIHGSLDHTIPVRNLKSAYLSIPGGSHMMTLTRSQEVSAAIQSILIE